VTRIFSRRSVAADASAGHAAQPAGAGDPDTQRAARAAGLRAGPAIRAGAGQLALAATARPLPSAPAAEISALQAALAAEHAAIYGYGVVGAHLTGTALATAKSDWIAHQLARDSLEAILRSAGAQPVAAAAAYRLPHPVRGRAAAMALAVTLEDRVTTAYLGLVAVTSTRIRAFGARGVLAAALRAASWRGRTVAFPGLPAAALAPRKTGRG
jgi:hypothetical protein